MCKRRILSFLLVLTLILTGMAITAHSATQVDTGATGSLALTYRYDGQAFTDQQIRIYRIAEISAHAEFMLTGAFAALPVEINAIKTQEEWNQVASTLSAFVVSESIAPDLEEVTDADGSVSFAQLPLGLYLVDGVHVDLEDGYCRFDSFVISIPDLNEADEWVYDVVANPKSVYQQILPEEITYTVNKLWKDEGYEHLRPQAVTIDLFRNGEFVEAVVLSEENNWSYSWVAEDDGTIWQAVETSVPEGYTVTLEQKDHFFFVTNGYDGYTPPPATGETTNVQLYWILLGAAGAGLVLLGILGRKRNKS